MIQGHAGREPTIAAPSLDTIFGLALAGLSPKLVSDAGATRARQMAQRLPPATAMLLEHKLLGEPGGVDISIRIDGRDDTRAIVERRHPTIALPPALVDDPAWRRAAVFCAAWRDAAGPLAAPIETAWLEFDDCLDDDRVPWPLFYVSHPETPRVATSPGRDAFTWVADTALPLLLNREWAQALQPALTDWLGNPDVARLRHVGVMWGRADAGLRLCMTVPLPALAGLLATKAPLPQATAAVTSIHALAGAQANATVLHVDLAPGLGPTLGFELKPAQPSDWRALFDRLVAMGLCDGPHAEAALGWPSIPPELVERRSYGNFVTSVSAVLSQGEAAPMLRRINHIKVTMSADGQAMAKVYLSAVRVAPKAKGLLF